MIRIHIISGDRRQAEHLARIHQLNPTEWCYVDSPHRLQGQRRGVAWIFGTYWQRHDIHVIEGTLRALEFFVLYLNDR
jgi:hypothetical protein